MKIPDYARYDYCNKRACDFLEQYEIKSFPIDVEKIIINNGWGLTKYSELMNVFSCDLNKVIQCLGSKDGYTQLDDDNYSIAYNDAEQLGNRKRFTLMHEIGHIYLNHLIDFEATKLYRGSLTKEENIVLENEANAFARNVLVPTAMLEHLKDKSIYNISLQFGITEKAARTRRNLYLEDLKLNKLNNIRPRLYRIFYNFYYKKKCITCGHSIVAKSIKYCPVCGKQTLQWGDGKMKYPKIEIYENGKLKKCPVCDNEETEIEGNFCQICHMYLVNECANSNCSNYENVLPTNARYCPICGGESLFLTNNILRAWNQKLPPSPFTDGFMNIPDEEDSYTNPLDGVLEEGLPFN